MLPLAKRSNISLFSFHSNISLSPTLYHGRTLDARRSRRRVFRLQVIYKCHRRHPEAQVSPRIYLRCRIGSLADDGRAGTAPEKSTGRSSLLLTSLSCCWVRSSHREDGLPTSMAGSLVRGLRLIEIDTDAHAFEQLMQKKALPSFPVFTLGSMA